MNRGQDPSMAVALQGYLTLHKRRSSYSSPEPSPLSYSSRSTSSSSTSSSSSSSPSPSSPPQLRRRMSSIHELEVSMARESKVYEIDMEILATLGELLRSKTAQVNKQFRAWVQSRLSEKERDVGLYQT